MKTILALMLVFGVIAAPGASAQGYPNKPIRLIVPVPAGGATDMLARRVAEKISLGVPVLVENKAGAGARIASQYVAQSQPDGYTLLMAGSTHSINNSLFKNVPYDAVRSFTPISLIGTFPMVLLVHPSVPVKNYREFAAYAKSNPEKIKCGGVPGGANHLAIELLMSKAGIKFLQVPYKGDAPMLTDLMGGHIDCVIIITTTVLSGIKEGKFKALAVTGLKRLPILPDVPTLDELGLTGYQAGSWSGVFAPASTPPAVVKALADQFIHAAREPSVNQYLSSLGVDMVASGPEGLREFLADEIARWKAVITSAKIVVE
ncbi:MAG: tripartite tricarboxylate transporter substrate binding protein [Betaproteobacteria bacterium]|nr:MAG: tripartite tricarboxylate transporter substrate binding protein [Betaproteobacteria bacterium]